MLCGAAAAGGRWPRAPPLVLSASLRLRALSSESDAAVSSAASVASATDTASSLSSRPIILPPRGGLRVSTARASSHRVGGVLSCGRVIELESGRLAGSVDGSATLRCGDTVLLGAVLPLEALRLSDSSVFVEYRERASASGRIPTTASRREYSSSEKEIATSQLIERLVRPLFSPWHFFDVRLSCVALSAAEGGPDADILGVNAASAALAMSSVPFDGPIGAARVARLADGAMAINPSAEQTARARFSAVIAVSPRGIQMVDVSGEDTSPEDIIAAVEMGANEARKMMAWQMELAERAARPKRPERFPTVAADAFMGAAAQTCAAEVRDVLRDTGLTKVRTFSVVDFFSSGRRGGRVLSGYDRGHHYTMMI